MTISIFPLLSDILAQTAGTFGIANFSWSQFLGYLGLIQGLVFHYYRAKRLFQVGF